MLCQWHERMLGFHIAGTAKNHRNHKPEFGLLKRYYFAARMTDRISAFPILTHQPTMVPQQKILRVFKLIRCLNQRPYRTLDQLAQSLDTCTRTVRRYIELLEELNYEIDSEPGTGRYFLCQYETDGAEFSVEETLLMKQLLMPAASNPFAASILQKLVRHSELIPLADSLPKLHQARIIGKLLAAINEQKQVVLKNYHSANSDTIADRHVEPLEFIGNYVSVKAFEIASGQPRDFKVERIGEVQVLDAPQTYNKAARQPDLFGMSGPDAFTVTLHLTSRAYRLLIEEFPAARASVKAETRSTADGKKYIFSVQIQAVEGVGRFVLGLCDEIEVLEPEKLRQYLREKVTRAGF